MMKARRRRSLNSSELKACSKSKTSHTSHFSLTILEVDADSKNIELVMLLRS